MPADGFDFGLLAHGERDRQYAQRGGLLFSEVPLRSDLSLKKAADFDEALGLSRVPASISAARRCILANVLYAHARTSAVWVFYSRDRNHYATESLTQRYYPAFYKFAPMLRAVEGLEADGLVQHWRTAPSPTATHRSRLRATPLLLAQLKTYWPEFLADPREVIILRDRAGRKMAYPESARTFRMRRDVAEQNEFLECIDISVVHPRLSYDTLGFVSVDGRWIDPGMRSLHRVFNRGSFALGGRWYGGFWQGLPKDVRPNLMIDNQSVVELDFRACHLRLLCAHHGLNLPFEEEGFDPYLIDELPRSQIKMAFNIMLNASHERVAHGAVARELAVDGIDEPRRHASMLMQAVRGQFPAFEKAWCSGEGLRLQNADAEICSGVQRHLRRRNIPVLSVHDSFIAPKSSEDVLENIMNEEMARACRRLANLR